MGSTDLLPVLFFGHGSPMNALGGNAFSESLIKLGRELPKPKGILMISAHWETEGTQILAVDPPPTIHDFYGFPQELFRIQYPAPGSPLIVDLVSRLLGQEAGSSTAWGLDHGTWSVLRHLYPGANVPVTQLSLNKRLDFRAHFAVAEKLRPLREQGILIMGSGNIVHNLRVLNWHEPATAFPWALEFDAAIGQALLKRDLDAILDFKGIDPQKVLQSVPTTEHYLPLLYILAASRPQDQISFPFEEIQNGSISMRSVQFT